ncbi:MAG: lysine--tRNA ligase [Candidatus Sungbacteria bacterium RIFCSPLOWO2_02_FULL_54_10]|uniref:Lysine--tRNA ligase n=2 Tax=Candidatus Sungiibacteriota TaxID=1817917 RepID=A0A1G2L7W5_9BACT|nr:MAG: lysine--tRNA ligase [Candidatus Sungbacteria bacterium RIFCSPHIGHO2_01_FULL_54_26]OHA02942.1 MAG: lysine--tRNA ligase [Candidatus Sungbacteria bacterium RIFCSPHIGHO2_02_FULL_53_17]OHA07757.1 MAG: lysine--tRNA ligase [Candidatus Sungbacteria bacterium RIFCSPLOWO2_01_FULL_54_21]OHA13687.1 MAG: lysine--tRNA ligase [Candidatus Sungbacteria bacterium RIFCSPLOWO2_02_FULL_54_10]
MALEDIRAERVQKLGLLKTRGIDAFPAETARTHAIANIRKKFAALAKAKKTIVAAGRVMARREHGGSMFLDIFDGTAKLQAYMKKDVLAGEYDLAAETLDIGDVIEAEGILFKTKKEEETIEVSRWAMLAKSLLPLPEKWHGLQDTEERFRKRYLDLLMNEGVRERFVMRARLIKAIRDFHEKKGFVEVETPMFHPIPGGTIAKPFVTHHHALDTDFYLRIAPELYLKRLLVGGMERVFEIGKCFRNEGIDAAHNPEFTMLESYASYWDEEDMMAFVEDLFIVLGKEIGAQGEIMVDGKTVIFKKPFNRITFRDVLARYAQVSDYDGETRDSLAVRARQLGVDAEPRASKAKIADEIYKKVCRSYLIQPTFLIDHPLELSPLSKRRKENPDEVRRFQLIAGGMELTNAFAELNDPIDQRERFMAQEREREGGDEEAMRVDEEFLEAMEYGMPPAAGLGIGIDRVAMLFGNVKNIREVVLFPTLRPKA